MILFSLAYQSWYTEYKEDDNTYHQGYDGSYDTDVHNHYIIVLLTDYATLSQVNA